MPDNKDNGLIKTSLSEYVDKINKIFVNSFDENNMSFNTDPETPQGQLIASLALALYSCDSEIVNKINGTNIFSSQGIQTENICKNLFINRRQAKNSGVECEVTGVDNTIIPKGSLAKNTNNEMFELQEQIIIKNGFGRGYFVATDNNTLAPKEKSIINIVTLIDGWETITNINHGTSPIQREKDQELIQRYYNSTTINSVGMIKSIESSILSINDVKSCVVKENDTQKEIDIDDLKIQPHSIACFVVGGSDNDIFKKLLIKKPVGIPYAGDITTKLEDTQLAFYRVNPVEIYIQVEISIFDNFNSNGAEIIKKNLVSFLNNNYSNIGQNIIITRMYPDIYKLDNFEIKNISIGKSQDSLISSDFKLSIKEYPLYQFDNIKIKVVL